MGRLFLKGLVVLITFVSAAHINNEGSAPGKYCKFKQSKQFKVWSSEYQSLMCDSNQPAFEEQVLDDILTAGTFQMNLQKRNANSIPVGATFVFGNVGSGKSIVTSLLIGDLNNFNVGFKKSDSIPIHPDENSIDSNSTYSMLTRLLPHYYVSHSGDFNQSAFYDCPGFNSSGSSKAEIAQLYFLQHALTNTKNGKFIFTITYSSVMSENDVRQFATYATTFIKDVNKFKDSIGLIVTQVEEASVRNEEEILISIRNFLKHYIETEKSAINEHSKNLQGADKTNKILQKINFIKELLREDIERSENGSRIHVVTIPKFGDTFSNQSGTEMAAKLKVLQLSTLKPTDIYPGDFGIPLRPETLSEIEQVLLVKESRGLEKYSLLSSQGILKELERNLLGSQNEIQTLRLLNRFQHAFDKHFSRFVGTGHIFNASTPAISSSMDDDIDRFISFASQRLMTVQFFQNAMGRGYEESEVSKMWNPFKTVGARINFLTEFYNFCNQTYHTLGEYLRQVSLNEVKSKSGKISVTQSNVLDILSKVEIDIPNQIRDIWNNNLDDQSKKYLAELVQKQVPDTRFEISSATVHPACTRVNAIGRNVMMSNVMDMYLRHEYDQSCLRAISIVAVDKFYIDYQVDGNLVRQILQFMSVVAPVWEVVPTGTDELRTIMLNGEDWSAGVGGFFFGVYHKIYNSNDLLIRTNGGGVGVEHNTGGESGSIHLVSTCSDTNINIEACPGSGKQIGEYTENIYVPTHGISLYNAEWLRSPLFDCFSSQSEEFFLTLSSQTDAMAYTPLTLVTELESVEQDYYTKGIYTCPGIKKRRLISYYTRTFKVIMEMLVGARHEDEFALSWTGCMIIGRLINYRSLDISLNVFQTETYFEAVEADLVGLQITDHKEAINNQCENFKNTLDGKVKEVENIFDEIISSALKRAKELINDFNKQLVTTLDAFLKLDDEQEDVAEKIKKEIQAVLPLKWLFRGFNILATACRFLGPISAGNGMKSETSIGNNFLDGKTSTFKSQTKFTPQLPDLSDTYFEKQIDKISSPDDNTSSEKQMQARKRLKKVLENITIGTEVADETLEFVKQILSDDAKLQKLEMTILDTDKRIDGIKKITEDFHKDFAPGLDQLGQTVVEEASMLSGSSQSSLTANKFQIKKRLKNMQFMVKGLTWWILDAQKGMQATGLEVSRVANALEFFVYSTDNLEMALDVLFQLYSHIEIYQERKAMAQLIANVNSPTSGELIKIKDLKLRDALTRVSVSIKINMALEECKKAKHAFKQWLFPFPSYYLEGQKELSVFMSSNSFTDVVNSCRKEINKFRADIKKAKSERFTYDKYVYRNNFTGDAKSTRPFYVWHNDKWQDAIRKLFRGEEIHLKADVDMIGHENEDFIKDLGAIKFKFASLFIRAHDQTTQVALKKQLDYFRMFMTHCGISIHKVAGQHFVTRDKAQSFRYNLEKSIGSNGLLYKVEHGSSDILLSPYTWWTFRLRSLKKNVGFDVLQQFVKKVDLQLEGEGTYLDELEVREMEPTFLNDLNLSEYYHPHEPTDEDNTGEIKAVCGRSTSSTFSERVRIQQTIKNPDNEQRCYHKLECDRDKAGVTFAGEYQLVTDHNDDFWDFLRASEYTEDFIEYYRLTKNVTVIVEELQNNTYYGVTLKPEEEFLTDLGDGRVVTNTITINIEEKSATRFYKLTGFDTTNEVLFCRWGFNITFTAKNATAFLLFKRL